MEQNKPTNEIMTPEEMETNIQRFMQIRNDFYDAIKEIKPNVSLLKETNKSLVAHFEVFEKISKKAEDQIYLTIKTAGHDLMQDARKLFSPLIEELLREQILDLNKSVKTAEKTLYAAMEEKNIRPFYYTLLGWLLLVAIGFGIGCIVSSQNTLVIPQDFTDKMDLLDYKVDVLANKNSQEGKKKAK